MRIDKYLADKFTSRTKAAEAVDKGLVLVNGHSVPASYSVKENDIIEIKQAEENFVSLGGYKLQKAIKDFGFSVKDGIFADIGASTGGFTDCLFQNGAKKVYCVDVGESQLDERLKSRNIVIIDGFNARELNAGLFEEQLDGAVIDVSFISLTYILGAVSSVLNDGNTVIALIKPQFECESRHVGKNGIVKDNKLKKRIILKICEFAESVQLAPKKLTVAPEVKGKNTEYLIMLENGGKSTDYEKLLKSVNL